jgi:aspartate/tyrosine/aromatic aminotransferase
MMHSIFDLDAAYDADTNPIKVNLVVGAYRDDENKPWLLPAVEKVIAQSHLRFADTEASVGAENIVQRPNAGL